MKTTLKSVLLVKIALLCIPVALNSQSLHEILILSDHGLTTSKIFLTDTTGITFQGAKPLFSFNLNCTQHNSGENESSLIDELYIQTYDNSVRVTYMSKGEYPGGVTSEILFENIGTDTVSISNVVPFGEDSKSVNITGKGPEDLA